MPESAKLHYSRGAQFHAGRATLPFLFLLLLVFVKVGLLLNGHLLVALVLLPFLVAFFLFVFDFNGVEISLEDKRIREYHLSVFGRRGEWHSLMDFNKVYLDYESFTVNRADFTEGDFHGIRAERHGQFLVSLGSPENSERIILAELINYAEAQVFAAEVSARLSYPIIDSFNKRYHDSLGRRRR